MDSIAYRATRTLLLFFAVATIATIIAGQVPSVRRLAFDYGMDRWEETTGLRIEAEELSGFVPFSLSGRNIRYIEDGKTVLTAEDIKLTVSPWDLLRKQITFNTLTINQPVLWRRDPIDEPVNFEKEPSSWSVAIKRVEVVNLTFADELTASIESDALAERIRALNGMDGTCSVRFLLADRAWEVRAALVSERRRIAESRLFLRGQRLLPADLNTASSWDYRLSAQLEEDPLGALSHVLSIKLDATLSAGLDLTGTQDTWKQIFSGDATEKTPPVTGEVTATLTHTNPATGCLGELIGGRVTSRCRAAISHDRDIILEDLSVRSGGLTADGVLAWDRTSTFTQGRFRTAIALDRLSTCPVSLVGSAEGDLTLSGSFENPTFEWTASDQAIEADGYLFEQITGAASMTFSEGTAFGNVSFDGIYGVEPLQVYSDIEWRRLDDISLKGLSIKLPGASVAGDLVVLLPTVLLNGTLNGTCRDLAAYSQYFGQVVDGSADFSVNLYPTADAPSKLVTQGVRVESTLTDVWHEKIHADRLVVTVDLSGFATAVVGELKVSAQRLQYRNMQLTECSFVSVIDEHKAAWPYEFEIHGTADRPIAIVGNGTWQAAWREAGDRRLRLDLDTLDATAFSQRHKLEEPVAVDIRSGYLEVSPVTITVFDAPTGEKRGKLDVRFRSAGTQVRGRCRLDQVPLDIIAELYPNIPITAIVSGEMSVGNVGDHLTGDVRLVFDEVVILDAAVKQDSPISGSMAGSLSDAGASVFASITGLIDEPAVLELSLPVTCSSDTLEITADMDADISGNIAVHGRIEPLLQLFTDDTNRVAGYADIDVTIDGTGNAPDLDGTITLRDGSYESLYIGVIFTDIALEATATGNAIRLEALTANAGSKGGVTAAGELTLDATTAFPYDIATEFTNAIIFRQDYATIAVDGDVRFLGDTHAAVVAGDISLSSADLTIPKHLPVVIPKLNVNYTDGSAGLPELVLAERHARLPIQLDMNVDVPGTVTLSGRGLTSRWQGALQVKGNVVDPLVYGNLTMDKSQFEFAGRQFAITQGTLAFEGDPQDTNVSVQSELQLEEIKAVVILKGPIQNPQIFLYSNPSLPQKEIVSIVLFNKHSADITPMQGLRLAQTASTISGNDIGPDVLGGLRKSVGLDTLEIGSQETSQGREYSIQAGKYLSQGVYVQVNKALNADTSSVALEADLRPTIKLQGEVGADSTGKISLKWKKDY